MNNAFKELKYCLGIILDKHLVWDRQINEIRNKISCRGGILKKFLYFLQKKKQTLKSVPDCRIH